MLSGYKFLWVQVLFDLPVKTKDMRKTASKFRSSLIDIGFSMCQFSVYMKWCSGKDSAEIIIKKIKVPPYGKIHILIITDKQYERIITYSGSRPSKNKKNPDQYELF